MIKYNQKKKKLFYYKVFFIGFYFFIFLGIFLFNDMGYLKSKKIEKENYNLEEEIQTKIAILNQLEQEKTRLEEDNQYIEKIAREEFKMAKKGEKVFTIIHNQSKKGK